MSIRIRFAPENGSVRNVVFTVLNTGIPTRGDLRVEENKYPGGNQYYQR